MRSLEGEVRELKDQLDERDEKIDLLSRIRSNSMSPTAASPRSVGQGQEEVVKVQASPLLVECDNADSYFMGASSGRVFVGKLQQVLR